MANQPFRVQQVDHIELNVPDQYAAARWYKSVLGLESVADYEFWAAEGGPLMLSSDGGSTKLALFQGEPPGFAAPTGFQRVAFRVSGEDFIQFLSHAEGQALFANSG